MNLTIRGLQEAQQANAKVIAAVKPQGGLGRAVQYATTEANRYATAITHVVTGALRSSHRMKAESNARYQIYIDPGARNPRSGNRTSIYGLVEHARGGQHAFYQRTVDEQGMQIAGRAARYLIGELP
jgi:hypothetical protein